MAEQYGVRLLGELPLDARIREEADSGRPTVVSEPGSPRAEAYLQMARRTAAALALRPLDRSGGFPRSSSRRAERFNNERQVRQLDPPHGA
ncbi:hypothetical protein B1A_08711 [mine drainage metagenome]|uniref:Uncharacterized protein n=1 Tax=mine drainage metagenome TaxID=410659 RepID=T1B8I7_9ZZZZ